MLKTENRTLRSDDVHQVFYGLTMFEETVKQFGRSYETVSLFRRYLNLMIEKRRIKTKNAFVIKSIIGGDINVQPDFDLIARRIQLFRIAVFDIEDRGEWGIIKYLLECRLANGAITPDLCELIMQVYHASTNSALAEQYVPCNARQ